MKKIRIYGDLNYGTGYNVALRGLVQCLEHLGWSSETVHVVGASTSTYYREFEPNDWLQPYVFGEWWGDDEINIVVLNPGMARDYHTSVGNRKNVAYCSWETDKLPGIFVNGKQVKDDLNVYDEIWTPTAHVKHVLVESGVTAPIVVVPHPLLKGIETYYDEPRAIPAGDPAQLYTIGTWNARKNVEGLLRAYFAVGWKAESPVKLAVHCVPPTRDPHAVGAAGWIAQEGAKNLYQSAASPQLLPPFGLLTTPRSFQEMYEFHRRNNVFVTASCGEGFCIPIYEALALGNTVVASGPWVEELARELPAGQLIVVPSRKAPITPMPECRGYELDHQWWVPDQNKLIAALKRANDVKLNHELIRRVRAGFSVEAVARVVEARLKGLGAWEGAGEGQP